MSSLEELIVSLEAVNNDAERLAQQLAAQARTLGTAAAHAAAVAQHSARPDGAAASAALHAAQRAVAQAAQHLHHAAIAGRSFIARHAAAPGWGSGGAQGGGAAAARAFDVSERYLHPGDAVEARFQQLVDTFGVSDPAAWIGAGNPHYATGLPAWTNNCGPCARSFADAFQGVGTHPALGDSGDPPGEYDEMWEAVQVRPTSRMTNRNGEPAAFTESAYQALEAALLREGADAVAIVGVDWDRPGFPRGSAGGHWFNAYVDHEGKLRWADEQSGRTGGWPPGYDLPIWQLEAVVRPDAAAPWKEVVL